MIVETIPAALGGERIDRVVAFLTGASRSVAAALVEAGAVTVDGAAVTTASRRVAEGQRVQVDDGALGPPAELAADPSVAVPVVYADEQVIVVDKPAGVVVHPGGGVRSATLVHGLLARYPELRAVGQQDRPGIVHRLDKGTSGLMVVARTPDAYDALVAALAAHHVERQYVALVWGVPDSPRGVIDAPIGRSSRDRTRMAVHPGGRHARTHYEVDRTYVEPAPCALLTCTLETGRTHQIRVHLAAIGHAVVGDPDYRGVRGAIRAPRPMLHAARLAFDHPATGERCEFTAPLPADMAAVLGGLR